MTQLNKIISALVPDSCQIIDPDIQVISSGSVYDGYDIPSPGAGDYHLYTEPDTWVAEFGKFDNVQTKHIIGEMASTFPNGGTGWDSGVLRPFPWYVISNLWQSNGTSFLLTQEYE